LNAGAILHRPDGALRAPWRLLGFFATAVAAMWVLQFLVSLSGQLTDLHPTGPQVLMITSAILALSLLAAHAVMLRLVERRPWSEVGLGPAHFRMRPLVVHSAIGALAIGLPALVLIAIGWLRLESAPGGMADWLVFALATLALLAFPALYEELLFRGYAFAVLREAIGWRSSLLVTSLFFSMLHVTNPGAGVLPLFVVFLAGVWLALVLLATGSLVAAWLAHLAWNWALVGLVHAPVSGFRIPPPVYRAADAGPEWATGGSWGPEGGALAALCLAVVSMYLFRLWRRSRGTAE
jgi:uncharacterized protein